jgi:hypothetical protein
MSDSQLIEQSFDLRRITHGSQREELRKNDDSIVVAVDLLELVSEGTQLLWGESVGNELKDSFQDQVQGSKDTKTVQNLSGRQQGDTSGRERAVGRDERMLESLLSGDPERGLEEKVRERREDRRLGFLVSSRLMKSSPERETCLKTSKGG